MLTLVFFLLIKNVSLENYFTRKFESSQSQVPKLKEFIGIHIVKLQSEFSTANPG